MMKRILCLMLVLCCTLTLTGCVSTPENNAPAAPTLPPAEAKFAPPVGDIALNHTATAPLYLPSTDGQRLLTEYVPLSLNHSRHSAQVMVEALLQHPATQTTQALGNGVTLSLYGAQPVEVSSGVCTVNLAANALQLDQQSLYKVCAAITATLCEMDDIQYVNFLVADQAVSMDITGNLPLGGQTAHPGEELTVLWEQTDARRAPLGEDPATIPVTAVATLYFPLADGSGIAAETRNLTFPGQSADQLAAGLVSAL
ncbi:MAG: GerMN domain-containing protein, partial [Clostridia bacterium]|nr:GerMN domain-containing protein [Clostridia bacterium]